jgi:VIT1/CCC1 family predicted Fe2+/Mn2+ transporter
VLGLVQRAEAAGDYDRDPEASSAMAADEQAHALVVAGLAQRARARASGWFRAAVFGANDGLVSNFSLVLGMAGAGSSSQVILLAGLAGLLAGALSMAAGEYVSVRSQRELLEAASQELDGLTLRALAEQEAQELGLVFRARGWRSTRPSGTRPRCAPGPTTNRRAKTTPTRTRPARTRSARR